MSHSLKVGGWLLFAR